MKLSTFAALAAVACTGACEPAGEPDPPPVTPQTSAAVGIEPMAEATPSASATRRAPQPVDARTQLAAEALVLAEWAKADNRASCAPLSFASTGQARGAPRSANFAGGWAIAFDLPHLRSAYGVAGTAVQSGEEPPSDIDRTALMERWPYFRELDHLPAPAFAGYGVEGATPLSAGQFLRPGDQLAGVRASRQATLPLQRLEQTGSAASRDAARSAAPDSDLRQRTARGGKYPAGAVASPRRSS